MSSPRCPGCGELQRAADDVLDWYYHDARGLDGGDVMRALDAALSAASVRAGVDGLDRECVARALHHAASGGDFDAMHPNNQRWYRQRADEFIAAYKAALSAPDPGSSLIPRCVACGKDLVLGPMGWHCVTDHDPGEVAP
jgi:hypothetical protein